MQQSHTLSGRSRHPQAKASQRVCLRKYVIEIFKNTQRATLGAINYVSIRNHTLLFN